MQGESCTVLRLRLMRKLAMSHIFLLKTYKPPHTPPPKKNLNKTIKKKKIKEEGEEKKF